MSQRRYGRARTVAAVLDMHPKSVWRKARTDPAFPQPISVSPGYVVWDLDEIDAWVRRSASRPNKTLSTVCRHALHELARARRTCRDTGSSNTSDALNTAMEALAVAAEEHQK